MLKTDFNKLATGADLQKGAPHFDITRRGAIESYRVRPAGVGASSRAAGGPAVTAGDTEVARLVTASKGAIAALDQAEASGSPSAIRAARAELQSMMKRLETAKAAALFTTAMAKALARPFKMDKA